MKTKLSMPLRVIQLSDTHIRSEPGSRLWGVDVDASLSAVLAQLKTQHWPADLILLTGDLVQDDGATAYHRLRDMLAPLNTPVYCLPGNHDDRELLSSTLNTGQIRQERHIIVGSWQFILLDSSLAGSPAGHLAASELSFLKHILTEHPDYHTVIALHHHPVPIGSAWLDTMIVDNHAALFTITDDYRQVRTIIWGHIHQAFAGERRGVPLLGVPSTCVQFKPRTATPEADTLGPGYRWFELHQDGKLSTGVERVAVAALPEGQTATEPC